MRYASERTDNNLTSIVEALEARGFTVVRLRGLGGGIPDLLAASGGVNWLFEVKTTTGKLSESQTRFFKSWRGPKCVLRKPEDIDRFLGFYYS
jgi:hypothetical protein